MGRAQEIMVVLEDFISRKMVEPVPVYIDGLISEATVIHTTHPDYLNAELREKIFHQGKNPFTSDIFTQVDSYQIREDIVAGGTLYHYGNFWNVARRASSSIFTPDRR